MSILKQQKRLWFLAGAGFTGLGVFTLEVWASSSILSCAMSSARSGDPHIHITFVAILLVPVPQDESIAAAERSVAGCGERQRTAAWCSCTHGY